MKLFTMGATVLALLAPAAAATASDGRKGDEKLGNAKHIVVIYQENHSFDNLYGGWEGVERSRNADRRAHDAGQPGRHAVQVPAAERRQPHVAAAAARPAPTRRPAPFTSHFANAPFAIDDFIAPTATTCPAPGVFAPNGVLEGPGLPGGCTRDLVHRYYQEQYQLNGGKQDRYVTGSDAVGLTMGDYDTKQLPIYKYLHARRPSAVRDRRPTSSRRRSAARSSTTSGSSPRRRRRLNAATTARRRPALDGRRNGMPTSYAALHAATGDGQGRALTVAVRHRPRPAGSVRRLRGQHDPAPLPAVRARDADAPAAAADRRRRSATD